MAQRFYTFFMVGVTVLRNLLRAAQNVNATRILYFTCGLCTCFKGSAPRSTECECHKDSRLSLWFVWLFQGIFSTQRKARTSQRFYTFFMVGVTVSRNLLRAAQTVNATRILYFPYGLCDCLKESAPRSAKCECHTDSIISLCLFDCFKESVPRSAK